MSGGLTPPRAVRELDTIRPLHELTDAWRRRLPPPILEDCVACGGQITAASRSDADRMAAVQRHQVEPVHIEADEARGIPLAAWQLNAKAVR